MNPARVFRVVSSLVNHARVFRVVSSLVNHARVFRVVSSLVNHARVLSNAAVPSSPLSLSSSRLLFVHGSNPTSSWAYPIGSNMAYIFF